LEPAGCAGKSSQAKFNHAIICGSASMGWGALASDKVVGRLRLGKTILRLDVRKREAGSDRVKLDKTRPASQNGNRSFITERESASPAVHTFRRCLPISMETTADSSGVAVELDRQGGVLLMCGFRPIFGQGFGFDPRLYRKPKFGYRSVSKWAYCRHRSDSVDLGSYRVA